MRLSRQQRQAVGVSGTSASPQATARVGAGRL